MPKQHRVTRLTLVSKPSNEISSYTKFQSLTVQSNFIFMQRRNLLWFNLKCVFNLFWSPQIVTNESICNFLS